PEVPQRQRRHEVGKDPIEPARRVSQEGDRDETEVQDEGDQGQEAMQGHGTLPAAVMIAAPEAVASRQGGGRCVEESCLMLSPSEHLWRFIPTEFSWTQERQALCHRAPTLSRRKWGELKPSPSPPCAGALQGFAECAGRQHSHQVPLVLDR